MISAKSSKCESEFLTIIFQQDGVCGFLHIILTHLNIKQV